MKRNLTNTLFRAIILACTISCGISPTLAHAACSNGNRLLFGANCDGWNLGIVNASDNDIVFAKQSSKAVYFSPEKITPSNSANTQGRESWTGGPADMRIYYTGNDLRSGGRFIYVTATRKGETTITCGTWEHYGPYRDMRYIYEHPSSSCAVTQLPTGQEQRNNPVEVVFVNKGTTRSPF